MRVGIKGIKWCFIKELSDEDDAGIACLDFGWAETMGN